MMSFKIGTDKQVRLATANAKRARQNSAANADQLTLETQQLKEAANRLHQEYEDCVEEYRHF